MYAVFKSGGKQHRVQEGEIVRLEKLEIAEGDAVEFDEVLLVGEGESVSVGAPFVSGSRVSGEVVAHGRGEKVKILKFRRRKHHMKQAGHRQWYTDVKITGIAASGAKPAVKTQKVEEPKAEAPAPAVEAATETPAEQTSAQAADLTAVSGVGPAMVKKFEAAGITTLEQLANLSGEDQEKIGEELSIAGKLEGWIEQAKQLVADEG